MALTSISSSNGNVRVMFKAGKNWDGYFTNNEILAQANRAMDILDNDYPDDMHVFFMITQRLTQCANQTHFLLGT